MIELHHGDCLDVLRNMPDGAVNATITDPPYSERTHSGHDATASGHIGQGKDNADRKGLGYQHWTRADVDTVIPELCRVCSGWVVVMTDTDLAVPIRDTMTKAGRYAFAPLPYYAPGSRVRLSGDGPSSWTVWIVVCRTAEQMQWGTLPGGYMRAAGWEKPKHMGGKPVELMRALVRDYSRPGDVVLDPFLGAGTTGVACKELGRGFIGCEIDRTYYDVAKARIDAARHKPGLCFEKKKRRKREVLI